MKKELVLNIWYYNSRNGWYYYVNSKDSKWLYLTYIYIYTNNKNLLFNSTWDIDTNVDKYFEEVQEKELINKLEDIKALQIFK